jgi:hypothetical protein
VQVAKLALQQHGIARQKGSSTGQLGHFKRVFDLDSHMPHGAHDFGVAQQQLY